MGTADQAFEELLARYVGQIVRASNERRHENWYEPADVVLRPKFAGPSACPTLIGWHAALGDVEVDGGATAVAALISLRDTVAGLASFERSELREYTVIVGFDDESGDRHVVGSTRVRAGSMSAARERAIDELFDERLRTTGCSAFAIAKRIGKRT